MKQSEIWNFNLPELSDPIDVREITRNFELIDLGLEAAMCRKTRKTNTLSEQAYPPAIRIKNYNDFDIEVVDRAMLGTKIEIKAGEIKTINIRQIRPANFFVEGLHEAQFEWYIPTEKAIEEGGGGSGGTSNYNDLENQPKINNVTLTGNKSFQDLGLLNSDGVIKSDFLPPFVDNMDSYPSKANFPAEGVEDRLYLAKDTNLAYVWTGVGEDKYACVGTSLALGETSSTAYRGDRGKTAYDHSQSTHARTDATKTEASQINGNIKINGTETPVYQHPGTGTNPHGTTAADLGLDKALKYSSQSLSETDKAQARQNIGAGTSSFNGQYSSLTGIPQSFTPASHTHPSTQVTGLGAAAAKGVDTTMPASATDNNVPTTQLMQSQLNKKANKTEVSSSNETTSVINVTDAKAQMAMVASIKGKTVKKNIIRLNAGLKEEVRGGGVTYTPVFNSKGELEYINANGTAQNNAAYMLGKVGSEAVGKLLSLNPTGDNARFVVELDESPWTNCGLIDGKGDATVKTIPSGKTCNVYITVEAGKTLSNVKCYPMIRDTGTNNSYQPPETLWSAPVESVVSVGKNRVEKDKIEKNCLYNTNGRNNYNGVDTSDLIKVTPGKDYWCGMFDNTGTRIADVVITTFSSESSINAIREIKNNSHITPASGENYIRVRNDSNYSTYITSGNYVFVVAEGTASIFIPYNKTTVLVPSSVKNLPDYGCSVGNIANEIDFENGVYYHRVKKIKLATLSWENPSDYQSHRRIAAANVKTGGSGTSTSLICNVYTADTSPVGNGSVDKTICFYNASLYVSDWSKQTDKATFVKYLQDSDAEIVYELASVETIPLSDYLRPLPVENGGTLTLVNEHNLDMPSVIKYKKEV